MGLAVLPLLVYGRFILGDELSNADVFLAYRPAHAWLADGLRQGQVRLWNADILGGFPLAFSEYGWFSPLNWVPLVLFGGHAGFYLAVALYVGLAGVAAFALARAWGCSTGAALLAGTVFSQSPFVVGGAPLINQGAAYWTLPALLWCVERHFAGARVAGPATALVLSLALLGSHPQLALIVATPGTLYGLWLALQRRNARPLFPLAAAAALGLAGAAVRLLPTLPLLAASERSGGLSLEASALGSVHPVSLLAGLTLPSLTLPRFVDPQWTAYLGPLPFVLAGVALGRGRSPRHVFLAAIGVAGLLLALGSYTPLYWLILTSPLLAYFREPSRFLLWTVFAAALLAAFGLDQVLQKQWRVSKWIGRLAALGLAVLVIGLGATQIGLRLAEPRIVVWGQLQALQRPPTPDYPPSHYVATFLAAWRQTLRATNPIYPGLLAPLAAAGLTIWWCRREWGAGGAAAAVACAALPLLTYGQVKLPAIPAPVVRETPPSVAVVRDAWPAASSAVGVVRPGMAGGAERGPPTDTPQVGPDSAVWPRTLGWLPLAADFEHRTTVAAHGGDADVASYRLQRRLLTPNFGIGLGVPVLDGYENLMTREQAVLAAALGSERSPSPTALGLSRTRLSERRVAIGERWSLFAAVGGGALLSVDRMQPRTWPSAVRYEPRAVPAGADVPALNAFLLSRPSPHVFLVDDWAVVDSAEAAVRDLMDNAAAGGEPRAVVVDAGGDDVRPRRRQAGGAPRLLEARLTRHEERVVEVQTDTDAEALLVLLDANAPGWSATVTGAAVPILTANVAFRAVPVPAGRHLVRFTYVPPYWGVGLTVTTGAAVILCAWLALALVSDRISRSVNRGTT